MSCRIQVLSETVANQIAAGEVVERPASIVKELVENALDAEATAIEIDVYRGGKTLLRVTDNGMGMNREEAEMALQRHATSKLRALDDLLTLGSYGFRGEALPSIASIAHFKLITRPARETIGAEIVIDSGRLVHVKEAAAPAGTSVEVRSLFSNVPARRKFLRSDLTEWHHIDLMLRPMTLTRLSVAWSVRHNDEPIYQLPPATQLKHRLESLFGPTWAKQMMDISWEEPDISIRGMIGEVGVGRVDRSQTFFFINQRLVQSPLLNAALAQGYQSALPPGRYPPSVLFIQLPLDRVDINVHPSKKEVRFHDPSRVRAALTQVIQRALQTLPISLHLSQNPMQKNGEEPMLTTRTPSLEAYPTRSSAFSSTPLASTPSSSPNPALKDATAALADQAAFQQAIPLDSPLDASSHGLRLLGSTLGRYILAEHEKGLVLIDQRAAHERILFEAFEHRMHAQEIPSQSLLLAATVELNSPASERLAVHQHFFQSLGIGLHHLGGQTWMIDALPSFLQDIDPATWIETMMADEELDSVSPEKQKQAVDAIRLKILARHSVPHQKNLSAEEVQKLVHDLHLCSMPYSDPGGRPTMLLLQRHELATRFGRKPV